MQVKWTLQALTNLDDAVEYIAGNNPPAAKNVAQRIWQSWQFLAFSRTLAAPAGLRAHESLSFPTFLISCLISRKAALSIKIWKDHKRLLFHGVKN